MKRYRNKKVENYILENLSNKEIRESFEKKLMEIRTENYYQIISEIKSIYIFEKILKLPIEGINIKTFKNKDVDFVINFDKKKIYCEVKGNQPIKSWQGGNILDGVYEIINRAIKRARDKFLESTCNILIIADENSIKIPLINNPLLYHNRIVESFLNLPENEKISAIMLLGGQYYKNLFDYAIFYNSNPQKILPKELKSILDGCKFNKND